ncbi:cytochrome P450 [Amycolatopsis acidicola]|uniref:Cytochrome P450 n=1 Tax=Amycolatopsis acidicola TaxID=2596893 RepID=A0A5N0V246_9PSEU|nr:cytochrome P450 [Amycolatopsis acidicola]KAA9157303.1 cytochrome P450 [Amycolatopsis acidicola]
MKTKKELAVEFDHHSPDFNRDPVPELTALRQKCPLGYTASHDGYWVATTYDNARRVLSEPENFTVERSADGLRGGKLIPSAPHAPLILPGALDGPPHDRLRDPLRRFFLRPNVEAHMAEAVTGFVAELLATLRDRDEFEFASEFSFELTVRTIFRLVGLDDEIEDKGEFIRMLEDAFAIDPEAGSDRDSVAQVTSSRFLEAEALVKSVVVARKVAPTEDLIGIMVAAEPELTVDEIVSLTLSLVLGGVRTTAATLENVVWHLDQDRKLREELRADPARIPRVIDELVRYYPATPVVARTAVRDVELDGALIHEGDRIAAVIPSANLDEDRFPCAERIDPDRRDGPPLTFGAGIHFCMGIWLAKMELRLAVAGLLAEMPDYEVDRAASRRFEKLGVNNGWARLVVRPRTGTL